MTPDDYVTFAWNAELLAKAGTFEVELRDGVWTMRLRTSGATYVLSGANAVTVIRGLRKLAGVPLALEPAPEPRSGEEGEPGDGE